MLHAEYQFEAPPYGTRPVSKQLVFDECFTQNTNFRPRHMAPGQFQNRWFVMNASRRIPISGRAIRHQAGSHGLGFGKMFWGVVHIVWGLVPGGCAACVPAIFPALGFWDEFAIVDPTQFSTTLAGRSGLQPAMNNPKILGSQEFPAPGGFVTPMGVWGSNRH